MTTTSGRVVHLKVRHSTSGQHIPKIGSSAAPFIPHPLVLELKGIRRAKKLPVKTLAGHAGIDENTVFAWEFRSFPTLPNFDAALRVLGYQLAIVPCRKSGPNR